MKSKPSLDELGERTAHLLELVRSGFKPYSPESYLYRQLVGYSRSDRFLTDDHIEMIYVTLGAWGMSSRAAKLAPYEKFLGSVRKHVDVIKSLKGLILQDLSDREFEWQLTVLSGLYKSMAIAEEGRPPFVSFSKAMHFMLPDLCVPMDRHYTLNFFGGEHLVSTKGFELYGEIYRKYRTYAINHPELSSYLDNKWNLSVPKILDNIVIGYRSSTEGMNI